MNIKLNLDSNVGGIFSLFMQMVPMAISYDIDNIYLNAHTNHTDGNLFDLVLNQSCDESYVEVECVHIGTYSRDGVEGMGRIEKSKDFKKMKEICSKIDVKCNNRDYGLSGARLGVHVRLGDMNINHPQYGIATTQDYVNKINELQPDSIYIASDNDYSIKEILANFKGIVSYSPYMIREMTDDYNTSDLQYYNLNRPEFWEEAFIEMMMLSRCRSLLCRVSNLSNAAILFSNTINEIHRL